MRTAVLILAILGAATSAFLGWKWYSDSSSPEVKQARELVSALGGGSAEIKAKMAELDNMVLASYFLMAAGVLGIVGGVLAFSGKGTIAGIVLLLTAAVPGVLAAKSLVFSCPLLLAGGLSFLIRPKPAAASGE